MANEYWLADAEARVLGPIGLDVVRDLAVRGKLRDVKAVSRDGKTFAPLRDVPEIQTILAAPPKKDDLTRAQADATRQIREWLDNVKKRSTPEVFHVPPDGSKEAFRTAFFTLVHRYVPTRLPPDATAELRLACEDAFLHLSERMVDVERQFRAQKSVDTPVAAPANTSTPPQVTWRGGMIHAKVNLVRGDARAFIEPEFNWSSDCIFVASTERVMVGTPAEVRIAFEGHVTQIHANGRVVGVKAVPPAGFGVKLLDLSEDQRSMIRTWVARAR